MDRFAGFGRWGKPGRELPVPANHGRRSFDVTEEISVAEPSRRDDRKAAPTPGEPQDEAGTLDPQEAAYRALHGERDALERALMRAQQRQQFGDDADAEAARRSEAELLKDLDRVMTLIRAAEIRRSQPRARRWQ